MTTDKPKESKVSQLQNIHSESSDPKSLILPSDFKNPYVIELDELPIPEKYKKPPYRKTSSFLLDSVSRLLGLKGLADKYDSLSGWENEREFFAASLETMKISYSVYPSVEVKIPKTGPLIVISNHPFGALEALLLYDAVKELRPDAKFLANFMLERVEAVKNLFLFVDPFERQSSKKENINPMRQALRYLKDGGCLITFPAGTVSYFHYKQGEVQDPVWNTNIARLVRKTKAKTIPCFIHGRNSLLFQVAGMIHPLLRTALLPRQLLNKQGGNFAVQLGKPLPASKLNRFSDDRELTDYLRMRCYIQKNSPILPCHSVKKRTETPISDHSVPVLEAVKTHILKREFEQIPPEDILIERNALAVGLTSFDNSPNLLKEIGRLREITFREVGEGTGTECDLDSFDSFYQHLVCWNKETSEIVGAYRLIKTNDALEEGGLKSLYTNTLFKYNQELLDQLGPSIEVGRSFITLKYQRTLWPLLLLLRGLATYVAKKHPDHKTLFGPVSISNSFTGVSRQLLQTFLRQNNFHPLLSQLVQPRTSSEPEKILGLDKDFFSKTVKDLSEVSDLISDIELQEQGVPVLLKEYARLGGKIIGFNVDPDFNGALDGLIVVNLSKADVSILNRYLGELEASRFRKYHGII